ncbi:MAG: prepilin peptidase [Candidatus Nanoarchaeia archaeon]
MIEIFAQENWFLIAIALIWITGAIMQDFKRREVDNIWNFSLIAFALAYRAFFSVYSGNYWFFLNGLIGFAVFIALANLFYYLRLFAGGDAKLLMALGTVLPLTYNWYSNAFIFLFFIILFFVSGSLYSLAYSMFLIFANKKRFKIEFKKQFKSNKLASGLFIISGIILLLLSYFFLWPFTMILGIIFIVFPLLFILAKSIEESCMVLNVKKDNLTEGDWLYKDIIIKGKKIKATWDGLTKKDIDYIKKNTNQKILIKQGIPFTPSFLLGFLALLYFSLNKDLASLIYYLWYPWKYF